MPRSIESGSGSPIPLNARRGMGISAQTPIASHCRLSVRFHLGRDDRPVASISSPDMVPPLARMSLRRDVRRIAFCRLPTKGDFKKSIR
jgi:hypothetical protein